MPENDIDTVLREALTEEQYAVVSDRSREILTIACAGSGKSRTLAYRIARLLAEGAAPKSIVAFTFTEKAADSIKRRVADALQRAGIEPAVLGAMYLGTIHSFCQQVLGNVDAAYRQCEVLDENRLQLFLLSRYPALGLNVLRERTATDNYARGSQFRTIKLLAAAWSTMNDELVRLEDIQAADDALGTVLGAIRNRMHADRYIDFSSMIRIVADLLTERNPAVLGALSHVRHLMVDEYQDVNPAQERLISELHRTVETLVVVGDDDQAIYAWRGADVSNILQFQRRYTRAAVHTLSTNFRSTAPIVAASNAFIAAELGAVRMDKTPVAHQTLEPRQFGNLWFNVREDEATWVAERIQALRGTEYLEPGTGIRRGLTPGDFAVLMRSTRQDEEDAPRHAPFTRALAAAGIPYSLESGGGPFDRPQVAVLRDTFLLLRNSSPSRQEAQTFFDTTVLPSFPNADFDRFAAVLSRWGREIHAPIEGARRRVYPQSLVHELLAAFGIATTHFSDDVMRDIGIFSRMIQDVESVYISIDTSSRFQEICNFLQHIAETGYDTSTEDVMRRPDLVTVATVHKVKGLEFPVVFVVDVENQRFPKNRRSYTGWLPQQVIRSALDRGAYQATKDEEARLFYTALTRAERYLYVSGSERLPGGKTTRKRSPFALRLENPEIVQDATLAPANLTPCAPRPRLDEDVLPTSFTDIRYYLNCPRNYRFRKGFGFSPPIPEMFGFGLTVHTAVGKLHETFVGRSPTDEEAREIARQVFHLKHMPPSRDPVNRPGGYERAAQSAQDILGNYATDFSADFTAVKQVEVRFEIPARQAVITGAIDLLLRMGPGDRVLEARVVDFKAMQGSNDVDADDGLHWTELAMQVQLYAKAAREVLGENARTGAVHLLKSNVRVDVPINDAAVAAAISNLEWAVDRILASDYPMRPYPEKCEKCDFKLLCPKLPENFGVETAPPPIAIAGDHEPQMVRAFSEFEAN